MSSRTIRSSAISISFIARQFGVRVNSDSVDQAIKSGTLSTTKDLSEYFFKQHVLVKARKLPLKELVVKKYLFPCVGIMRDGHSYILAGADSSHGADKLEIIAIDPMDPTAKPLRLSAKEFVDSWSGQVILVSHSSGEASKDRVFDWKWFLPELYRFKGIMAVTFIIAVILHLLGIAPIIYIQIALDKVLGYEAVSTLYVLTGGAVLVLLFSGILTYGRDYVIEHISVVIESRLTGDVFDKLLDLPAQTFQTTGPSEMEAKVQSVVAVRAFFARQILTNLYDATGILVFVPILFGYSPILALVVVGFSILQGVVDLASKYRQRDVGKAIGQANRDRVRTLRETIASIDAVKTLSQENIQRREWRSAAAKSIRRNVDLFAATNVSGSINSTLMNLMTIAIVFTGINLVFAGELSAGAIISCNMLGAKVVAPTKKLITFFADTHIITGAMGQISEIWNANPDRIGGGAQHVIKGDFVFKDVSVKFGDHDALKKINLTIPSRNKTAIVGRSASGKSTFLRLLQGLLKPTEGFIEIDAANLASLDLNHYRSQVSLVDLHPTFFAGTIEENIRRVRPNISLREMEVILDITGLGSLVKKLPDGLSTEIDGSASNLSQSHKIIVALARGLGAHPNLLLLDETFSSLDKQSQVHLKTHLDEMAKGRTLIATIHDMRLIGDYNWIIVLDHGEVVGQGTHESLVENCPIYCELLDWEGKLGTVSIPKKSKK
ncbi:MAG: hypothetical protein CMF70_00130 [Magnetovibrio sp.]|nr:hypothetical protein [Magnetovibrio sp.]